MLRCALGIIVNISYSNLFLIDIIATISPDLETNLNESYQARTIFLFYNTYFTEDLLIMIIIYDMIKSSYYPSSYIPLRILNFVKVNKKFQLFINIKIKIGI